MSALDTLAYLPILVQQLQTFREVVFVNGDACHDAAGNVSSATTLLIWRRSVLLLIRVHNVESNPIQSAATTGYTTVAFAYVPGPAGVKPAPSSEQYGIDEFGLIWAGEFVLSLGGFRRGVLY